MKNRLPVYIEELELPKKSDNTVNSKSYGYVSVMYLLSLIITTGSVLVILFFRK